MLEAKADGLQIDGICVILILGCLPHKDVCFGLWLVLTWILRMRFRDVSARYCDRRVRKIL